MQYLKFEHKGENARKSIICMAIAYLRQQQNIVSKATVVNDAIRFVSSHKSKEKLKSFSNNSNGA
jgi:hypothetical protein